MNWTDSLTLEIRTDEVDASSSNWALLVEGSMSVANEPQWFRIVACSPGWIGAQSWADPGVLWSFSDWPGVFFPWGFVVLKSRFDEADVELAIATISTECERIAEGDAEVFLQLMSRFVRFDDDPFRLAHGQPRS